MFEIFKERRKYADDEPIDFESMYIIVNQLGVRGYRAKHFEICKKIWDKYVPESGQSDALQGELLRQAEMLRNEAMDNGNKNWDDNFVWFCNLIAETLISAQLFDESEKNTLRNSLEYIKQCGEYAKQYNDGKIPDDEVNPMLFAYTDDDLYDYIEDAIARFSMENEDVIPYKNKDFIYR